MENKIFGKRLKKLRNNKGISMEELAEKFGVTKSGVSMWENNGNVPKQETLIAISKYFNVSIDYLLGNENMEGKKPENITLEYIQRNLEKLDDSKLEKAEALLKTVFDDIFEDEEENEDDE